MSEMVDRTALVKLRCLNCNVDIDVEKTVERCSVCEGLYVRVAGDPLIGTIIGGKYRVTALIGVGGMGKVYNAVHEHLHTEVALKMLPDTGMDIDRLRRFQHEAKLASSIVHGGIVRIQDFGVDPSPFIVMEKVSGETLSIALERTRGLESGRAIQIGISICDAMDAAHKAGLLHRDLKPSNVMIDASSGLVKIIDFGLAKAFLDDVKLTRTGETVGSPPYMSPEQCRGEILDVRSDIYSFGCMLYEILTGRPPFQGENMIAAIFQHLEEQPKTFHQVRPDLSFPKGLEAVVRNCLNKEPSMRYQSMSALRDDLVRVSQGKRVDAFKPRPKKKPVVKLVSRVFLAICVVAIVFVLVVGEKPLPVVLDGNELAVGNNASSSRPVFVKMQERRSLNGLTKEQFFALRAKQLDENKGLLRRKYKPVSQPFSQIDWAAPWLSYEGLCYRMEDGPSVVKGTSVESDIALNPLLLIRAEIQTQPPWRKDFIANDAESVRTFPHMGAVKTLLFDPSKQLSDVTYDVTDHVERSMELNDWKTYVVDENSEIEVCLLSLNAWDFGYNYMFVTEEKENKSRTVTTEPVRICQVYHKVRNFHGAECNCSHFPLGRHGYYTAPTKLKFPAAERVLLWKQEPKSAKQPPDFTCWMHFDLDSARLTNVDFLKKRRDELIASEGADSKNLLSVYRRLGDASGEDVRKAARYYGQAIRIASLHMKEARMDLQSFILPEFMTVLSGDAADLNEVERIANEQKWPASTTKLVKELIVSGKGMPAEFWTRYCYQLRLANKEQRLIAASLNGLSFYPDEAYLHSSLAYGYAGLDRWTEAEAEARKALALDPDDDDLMEGLSWILLSQRKFDEAVQVAQTALKAKPDSVKAYELLASANCRAGKLDRAESFARRGLELQPKNYLLTVALATVLEEMKKYKDAEAAYQKALTLTDRPDELESVKERLKELPHE
ncbi:MAG: protein kinase [Candidatus Obscuribacterales bacterium]|nr:protein kinase [Candidatus Obscuribacterales bacterium]